MVGQRILWLSHLDGLEVYEYRGVLIVVEERDDQRSWMPSHKLSLTAPWIVEPSQLDPWQRPTKNPRPHTTVLTTRPEEGRQAYQAAVEWIDKQLAPDDPEQQTWQRIEALRRRFLAGIEQWHPVIEGDDTVDLPQSAVPRG